MRVRHIYLLLIIVLAILAVGYATAAEPKHLPPETPTSATLVVCQLKSGPEPVLMVLVYPRGEVVRIDAQNLSDYFASVTDLLRYGTRATDILRYDLPCISA